MALRIRLARSGTKKRPFYHIVVADVRAPRDGRHLERLGSYNPLISKTAPVGDGKDKGRMRIALDEERIKFWLERGAQPSDRVARFLDAASILEAKPRQNPQKAKPKAKAQARAQAILEAKEAQKTADADAAAAAAKEKEEEATPAEKASAESPTEESPAEESLAEEAAAKDTTMEEPLEEPPAEPPAEESSTEDSSQDEPEQKT